MIHQQKNHRSDDGLDEPDRQQTVRMPGVPAQQLPDVKGDKGTGHTDGNRDKATGWFFTPDEQLCNGADN
jgi:hypothetical protein